MFVFGNIYINGIKYNGLFIIINDEILFYIKCFFKNKMSEKLIFYKYMNENEKHNNDYEFIL